MNKKKILPRLWKNPRFLAMQALLRIEKGNVMHILIKFKRVLVVHHAPVLGLIRP
ncbi:MAG: hypothetical protein LBF82_01550 [Lactobacillales bacterium]|jgi:hypothetical protein|nr:hypothetical protein [Lactobacillales bacterium]